jgi:hypothetical protein
VFAAPASINDTEAPEVMAGDDVPDRSSIWNVLPGLIAASAVTKVTVSAPSWIDVRALAT